MPGGHFWIEVYKWPKLFLFVVMTWQWILHHQGTSGQEKLHLLIGWADYLGVWFSEKFKFGQNVPILSGSSMRPCIRHYTQCNKWRSSMTLQPFKWHQLASSDLQGQEHRWAKGIEPSWSHLFNFVTLPTVDSAYSGHLGTGLKWPQ